MEGLFFRILPYLFQRISIYWSLVSAKTSDFYSLFHLIFLFRTTVNHLYPQSICLEGSQMFLEWTLKKNFLMVCWSKLKNKSLENFISHNSAANGKEIYRVVFLAYFLAFQVPAFKRVLFVALPFSANCCSYFQFTVHGSKYCQLQLHFEGGVVQSVYSTCNIIIIVFS